MKRNKTSLVDNKKFQIVLSVVAAIIFWFFVSIVISPDSKTVIKNVPVNIDLENTAVEKLDLSLFNGADQTIDITVSGKKYDISQLTKDDFSIDVSLSSVVAPGEYNLSVTPVYNGKRSGINIVDPINKTLPFTFDYMDSKTFDIEPDISNVKFQSDYTAGLPQLDKDKITITGPRSEISLIDKVVAVAEKKTHQSGTVQVKSKIVLYDSRGDEYTSENIKLKFNEVNITVPLVSAKTVPIILSFGNAPAYYKLNPLKYTVNPANVKIEGISEVIEGIGNINAGTVNFNELSSSKNKFIFDVDLQNGVVTEDGESKIKVTASVDLSEFKETVVNIKKFKITNAPEDADIKVITDKLTDVKLMVPKTVSKVDTDNLYAVVDIENKAYNKGKYTLNITVTSSDINKLWAVGKYSAVIEVL